MNDRSPTIAILTPIPPEWRNVCRMMSDCVPGEDAVYSVMHGRIGDHAVVCVRSDRGEGRTALAVKFALDKWKPAVVIISGIAGGFRNRGGKEPGRGPRRGDVVVANFVYNIDVGKIHDGKYLHRPDNDYRPDEGLRGLAETFIDANPDWHLSVAVKRPDQLPSSETTVRFGYVGSGNALVDDANHPIFRAKLDDMGPLDAIEMEACGAVTAMALESSRRFVRFMMVRGISDEPRESSPGTSAALGNVGSDTRDKWKEYAAAASATFLAGFLSNLKPGAVVPQQDGVAAARLSAFQSVGSAANRLVRSGTLIPSLLQHTVQSAIQQRRAVLIEGRKGAGKSSAAIAASLQYAASGTPGAEAFYLNAGDLSEYSVRVEAQRALRHLTTHQLIVIDDLHKEPQHAIDLVTDALRSNRGKLLAISRPLGLDMYERLHDRFSSEQNPELQLLQAVNPLATEGADTFVAAALSSYRKPSSPEVVAEFRRIFERDLTALFNAIEEWQPDTPIRPELAGEYLTQQLETSEDFNLKDFDRERSVSCLFSIAALWQFEMPTARRFLSETLKLDSNIPVQLAERGALARTGQPGQRTFELNHELEARRYIGIAHRCTDFLGPLFRAFELAGLRDSHNPNCLVSNLMFLWLGNDEQDQVEQLRVLSNILTYRGYTGDLARITKMFRENSALLHPKSRVQMLVIGAGVRRRESNTDEAEMWLAAADKADLELGGGNQGRLQYERAYLSYYRNDFLAAERQFRTSSEASRWPVPKEMSLAQADQSALQAVLLGDLFSRNLPKLFPDAIDRDKLRKIEASTLDCKRRFAELADNNSLTRSDRDNALRWVSNCLLGLAQVAIELDDLKGAAQYLEEEVAALIFVDFRTATPWFSFLKGRFALLSESARSAIPILCEAEEEYRRSGQTEGLGDVLVTLGDAYWLCKETTKARDAYTAAHTVDPNRRNGRAVNAAGRRLQIFGLISPR